ncbi:MAG: peptidoglycan-associated lipoprotein Pal [Rhodomicrobiaceae bacterium]
MPRSPALRLFVALSLVLAVAACSRSNPISSINSAQTGGGGDEDGPIVPGTPREFATRVGDTVLFLTDSTTLTPEAQQILTTQAQWLNQYPQYRIIVEGHADERGTREYNIALGAQRAVSTRHFLIGRGVEAQRIRTLSYGKERPVAVCPNISCWSQNRRAVTVVENPGAVANYAPR